MEGAVYCTSVWLVSLYSFLGNRQATAFPTSVLQDNVKQLGKNGPAEACSHSHLFLKHCEGYTGRLGRAFYFVPLVSDLILLSVIDSKVWLRASDTRFRGNICFCQCFHVLYKVFVFSPMQTFDSWMYFRICLEF